jgi:hypothetical protein
MVAPPEPSVMETAPVRAGVLGQAALALADGFARILVEKGLFTHAEYLRGYELAIDAWTQAEGHPQQHDVLSALRKIRPQD